MSDEQTELQSAESQSNSGELTLDFGSKITNRNRHTIPRRKLILGRRNIKSIIVEFDDGETVTFLIPAEQGFYRERWTYEEESDSHRIKNKLIIREIFWAIKEQFDPTMG